MRAAPRTKYRGPRLAAARLAGPRGLSGGSGFGRCRPTRRGGAAEAATFTGRRMVLRLAAAGAALLATMGFLVDRRPGPAFRLLARDAARFVAFLDMLGLPLLLAGIARLVAARHGGAPLWLTSRGKNARGPPQVPARDGC